ncbi:MAG: hypothetical protein DI623_10100 [Sphingomonas sanxanigenens]|uniref:Sulfotransferase n=1 Tax=Sphingomonas sanxanigenens TaxID=397260 RepID=A0A2W5AAM4_9SPHN|nr:MAG: hypothetical protein DI623_10100 [Sphingomonas sanxanigenens]
MPAPPRVAQPAVDSRAPARLDRAMATTPLRPMTFDAAMALGWNHARAGRLEEASHAFGRATAIAPGSPVAWRALADTRHAAGDRRGGDAGHMRAISLSVREPRLVEAARAMAEDRLASAEPLLRAQLKDAPTDVAAIRMLGELATRLSRYGDAERLLGRALELAPSFDPARHNLAVILYRQTKSPEALAEVETLLKRDAQNIAYRNLKAAILVRVGDYETAIATYRKVLADQPKQPRVWMSLGHALKTVGDIPASIDAYRRSIDQQPGLGESYWSLANLKTFRFEESELAAMRALLAGDALSPEDRFHIQFSLGKALEDAGDHAASFTHYAEGNRLRRELLHHDIGELTDQRERAGRLYTPAFFAARADAGGPAPDPIFVVGMPRSGSTLVEQILSSHPLIEGTMELPDMTTIVRRLAGRKTRSQDSDYPEIVGTLSAAELTALGEEYLDRTRIQRKTDRPYFIDKLPNNFLHVGLIRLILPKAKIVDVRRHPLGCCFSGYKQHFARGQAFSYDLAEIGTYYADYVRLMALWDAVLPGHVHRVTYEKLVADMEGETRALLAYLGLDFDPAVLRFYETRRAVRTPSAEQVRQPIYADGLEQWRHYEAWLGPLKAALGPVLDHYPDPPPPVV